jgi:hypothetical protein
MDGKCDTKTTNTACTLLLIHRTNTQVCVSLFLCVCVNVTVFTSFENELGKKQLPFISAERSTRDTLIYSCNE